MDKADIPEFKDAKGGNNLRKSLITILVREHRSRREMIYLSLKKIQERIDEAVDDMDVSMSIDHLNEILQSSIKNDENIVDLIELLLKYDYNEDEIKEIQDYKNELSENTLDISFEE